VHYLLRISYALMLLTTSLAPAMAQLLDSAQLSKVKVHYSLEEALKDPDSVYILVLRRAKLTEFPKEIFKFKNLQELDLSKNKLQVIPGAIGTLLNLTDLNLSRNRLGTLPPGIGNLKNLKQLIIYQNEIASLPPEIGGLESLTYLDMWGNELEAMPVEIGNLKNLVELDMRVIEISDIHQKEIHDLLPHTKIHFSNSCDCGG